MALVVEHFSTDNSKATGSADQRLLLEHAEKATVIVKQSCFKSKFQA